MLLKSMKSAAVAISLSAVPASAEIELSFYTGYQTAPHSRINGTYPAPIGGTYSALIGWDGKSFSMPPYYGLRGTWWRTETVGFGLEFSHNKVYSRAADRAAAGFSTLEMTDGINILTMNAMRRWPGQWAQGRITPYVGGGLGLSIPHVEATPTGGPSTFGYQVTGPAARLTAGAKYDINEKWSVFGEYQFTWTQNKADLNGGGTLNTRILTNALNFGVGFSF